MLISPDSTTLVADTIERLIGSDGSPYEKRVDAKGRVLSDRCIADEVPFEELPEGWAWARLESLCSVITDGDHQAPPQQADGIPFLVISDVSSGKIDFSNTRHVSSNYFDSLDGSRKPRYSDLLLTVTGSFGIVVPVNTEERFCFQRHIALLRPLGYRRFMINALAAPSTYAYFNAKATGTAQKTVSLGCLRSTLLALPPENEEPRIINQLTQLMPLVEEYGGLEDAREALDAALPGRLRKSVLQLAVRGGLVPQDPADEPAGVLLERIRGQRRKLVAEKKMKAPKGGESIIFADSDGRRYEKRVDARGRESDPVCIEDEVPFEIPEGWEWARLSSIASFGGGKTPPTNDRSNFTKGGVLWVTSKDMKQDHISGTIITLSDKGASGLTIYPRCSLIMVTRSGILRRLLPVAILDKPATVNQDQKVIVPDNDSFSEWLLRYFQASDLRIRSKYGKDGTTVESVIFDKVKEILVPIPSLAEQRRVIAHLEELMALTTN